MKFISLYIFTIFNVLASINISCNNNNSYKLESSFYYYPKVNVYYDASRATYIYSLDSGKTWDNMASNSNKIPATLGKQIIIDSPLSEVWKANEIHRRLYGGMLFNIMSSDTGKGVKKTSLKKPVQTNKTGIDSTRILEDTPRKRKGFFRKIFGKKKRKDA